MRVAPTVALSPEERSRLVRWARRHDALGRRARMLLRAGEGAQDLEIARELGVARGTVARWRGRFRAERLPGILRELRAPSPARIPPDRLRAIVRAARFGRAPGGVPWSTRSLARTLGVSHMSVQRVWSAYRTYPRRYRAPHARADPTPSPAPGDVVGLFLQPPGAALAVTLREERPGVPELEAGPPAIGRADAVDGRWGSPLPDLPESVGAATRAPDYLPFLETVARRLPRSVGALVVLVAPPIARRGPLEAWCLRHPRLRVERVADLVAWRTRCDPLVRGVGHRAPPRGEFRGTAELARALARSLREFRADQGRFVWVANARAIEAGEAAYRLRYDLAVTGHAGFKSPVELESGMSAPATPGPRARRMARNVLRGYLGLRRGEQLTLETWTGTLEEANAMVLEALRIGARPLVLYQDENTYWAATTEVPARHLAEIGAHRRAALERTDVFVSFFGPSDRERFHALPSRVLFPLGRYQDALFAAAERSGARAALMAVGRVSLPSARMYGVDAAAWREELTEGCLVPPKVLRARGRAVARRLAEGREVEIRHTNGTRLTLRLKGRRPVVSDGRFRPPGRGAEWDLVTFPAGVVAAALEESRAEGTFRSNVPSSVGLSDSVGPMAGACWTFRDGRLTDFRYDEGAELFGQSFDRAPRGERDRPGALSIGLNDHLARAPLLEDQGLGTVTLHLGRNDHLGGSTRGSWWAWSYLRGADVTVDGRPLLRQGRLASPRDRA